MTIQKSKTKKKLTPVTITREGIGTGILSLVIFSVILWLTIWHRDFLLQFSSLGYLGLLISNFMASAAVFAPLPVVFTSFISGNVFNPFLVGIFAGAGSALGDFVAFLFGFGARKVIVGFWRGEQKQGKLKVDAQKRKSLKFWFKQNAFLTVFVLSFLPNPLFDGVGILAGIFNMKPRDFLLATLLGRVLRNMLLAFGGQKLLS